MPTHNRPIWAESSDDDDQVLSTIRKTRSEKRLQQFNALHSPPRAFYRHGAPTPLVDRVTNQWKTEEAYKEYTTIAERYEDEDETGCCDLDNPTSCPNITTNTLRSKRFWLGALLWVGIVSLVYLYWRGFVQPHLSELRTNAEGFMIGKEYNTYGNARGGSFHGTRVKEIAHKLVPGGSADPHGERRLVFVGDIHGCASELNALLKKIRFDDSRDHLIATGDVVSKGPDSPGVLDILMRHQASCVRGNHEDRLLISAKSMLDRHGRVRKHIDTTGSEGVAKDASLLKQLSKKHLAYLANMPLILRIPRLQATTKLERQTRNRKHHITESIVVVHAGLVPAVALEKQDPYFVTNMRTINRRTHVPSAERSRGVPWYQLWNWYQARLAALDSPFMSWFYDNVIGVPIQLMLGTTALPSEDADSLQPYVVVYGHDRKAGLQDHRWSKGLDTGCVDGGKLTAMVMDATGKVQIVSVACQTYR